MVYLSVIFNLIITSVGFLVRLMFISCYYYESNQYIMSHLFLESSLIIKINEISNVPFPLAKYTVHFAQLSSPNGFCTCSIVPITTRITQFRDISSKKGPRSTTGKSLPLSSIFSGNRRVTQVGQEISIEP